jgi:Methyltransferase domain
MRCERAELFRDLRANPCSITLSSLGKGSLGPREPRPRGSRSGRRLRGTGIVARLARERLGADSRITGVDINSEMIAVARSIEPDISWHRGNALELPFENGSFDVVLCQQGFQFFSPIARPRSSKCDAFSRRAAGSPCKHVATARRKPSFSMAWIARPRVNLVPAPIAVFRSATSERSARYSSSGGFTHVSRRTVEKMLFFPDLESFLLLNLWALVADSTRNTRKSGLVSSHGCGRMRPRRLANSRVAPAFATRCGSTWSPPEPLSLRSLNLGKSSGSATSEFVAPISGPSLFLGTTAIPSSLPRQSPKESGHRWVKESSGQGTRFRRSVQRERAGFFSSDQPSALLSACGSPKDSLAVAGRLFGLSR